MTYDTSIVIEMIRRNRFAEGSISVLTLIEVLMGVKSSKREKTKKLLEEIFDIYYLDDEIILKYCELYDFLKKEGKLISDAYLIIAATALTYGEELITKDKYFLVLEKVGLRVTVLD